MKHPIVWSLKCGFIPYLTMVYGFLIIGGKVFSIPLLCGKPKWGEKIRYPIFVTDRWYEMD
jgi:hypothetical protein